MEIGREERQIEIDKNTDIWTPIETYLEMDGGMDGCVDRYE